LRTGRKIRESCRKSESRKQEVREVRIQESE
jgi:hypothetical protein